MLRKNYCYLVISMLLLTAGYSFTVTATNIKNNEIDLIINTPEGSRARSDGYYLRTEAVLNNITSITTISAASALIEAIKEIKSNKKIGVKAIQEY